MRAVFLLVSLAGALWVYTAALRQSGRVIEATFGAAVLAFSWEVGYHARWIATDAILMQFAALIVLLTIVHGRAGPRRSLLLATGAVIGLATATKYPGALLGAPLVVMTLGNREQPVSRRIASLMTVGGVAALVYATVSPGTLLEWRLSLEDIAFEMRHYQTGHLGQTVAPGLPLLLHLLRYLSLVAFSHYPPLSAAVFALVPVGVYALARRDRRLCVAIVSFPIIFLLYMSCQRVMIVRNVLCVLPFLALFAAMGLSFLRDVAGSARHAPSAIAVIAAAGLLPNAWWLHAAATTIVHRHERTVDELTVYASRRPGTRFLLSPEVQRLYAAAGKSPPHSPPVGQRMYVLWSPEVDPRLWAANSPGRYELLSSGPFEVNWDYYPSWEGDPRLVIVSPETVAEMVRSINSPGLEVLRQP